MMPILQLGKQGLEFCAITGKCAARKGQPGAHTPTPQIPESMLSWAVLFYPRQTPAGVLLPYDTDKCHFG